ncbi:hypothetical protein HAX54_044847, partial [Datura stramonium]|nr:hypothetical protein [Datura stramonium]
NGKTIPSSKESSREAAVLEPNNLEQPKYLCTTFSKGLRRFQAHIAEVGVELICNAFSSVQR